MLKRFSLLALFTTALCLSGCGGGGSTSNLPDPVIRLANLSPDSTALNLTIDDTQNAKAIGYLSVSLGKSVTQGERDAILMENAGTDQIDVMDATFGGNSTFLIAAIGKEGFGSEFTKRLQMVPIQLSLSTIPAGNKSRLIILNAFVRASGTDNSTLDFQSPGNNPIYQKTGIGYGTTATLDVDSGLQDFQAKRAGAESVLAENVTTLAPGKIYLAAITGIEGAGGAQAPQIAYIALN